MSQSQSKLARILAVFAAADDDQLTLNRQELALKLNLTPAEAKAAVNYGVSKRCLVVASKPDGEALSRYRISQAGREAIEREQRAAPPPVDVHSRSILTVVARQHVPNSVWDVERMDHLPNAGTGEDEPPAALPAAAPAPAWKAATPPIAPAPAAPPATPAAAPEQHCWCSLDPKGNLLICTRSASLMLLRSEARELLAYIDSLRGDELAEAILGDLGCE